MSAKIINLQEKRENRRKTDLVDCVSCHISIKGLTPDKLRDYPVQIDGIGPAHFSCYQENIATTKQFAKKLDERRFR